MAGRVANLNDSWYEKPIEKDGQGWGATEPIRGALCHGIYSDHTEAASLLDPRGAVVILGARLRAAGAAVSIVPGAITLFGPRGARLATPEGPLYIADTGHHRLLVWHARPREDHVPADLVRKQGRQPLARRHPRQPLLAVWCGRPTTTRWSSRTPATLGCCCGEAAP